MPRRRAVDGPRGADPAPGETAGPPAVPAAPASAFPRPGPGVGSLGHRLYSLPRAAPSPRAGPRACHCFSDAGPSPARPDTPAGSHGPDCPPLPLVHAPLKLSDQRFFPSRDRDNILQGWCKSLCFRGLSAAGSCGTESSALPTPFEHFALMP
jgi:hypothetical protein